MLWIIVFVANASVMIFEIIGARSMAPFIGSSSEVWSGVIASVLGGMTIGYWLGGKVADAHPHKPWLGYALVCAGIFILVPWSLKDTLFALIPALAHFIPITFATTAVGAVFFAPAVLALGAIGPCAAKQALHSLSASAQTVGRLSAVAAFGSVVGTIVVGAWLAPHFGNTSIIMSVSTILIVLGCGALGRVFIQKYALSMFVGLVVVVGCTSIASAMLAPQDLRADVDTAYNRIWVRESFYGSRPARFIQTDPFGTQCASYVTGTTTSDEPVFEYIKDFDVGIALGGTSTRALLVGGCNYSFPRWLLSRNVVDHIDVSEIDPGMTDIAREWFNLTDDTRLSILHEDGRLVFNQADDATYDLIFIDAFGSFSSTPAHIVTQESHQQIDRILSDDGFVVTNVISAQSGERAQFVQAYVKTISSVFAHVRVFPARPNYTVVTPQNIIIVASQQPFELPAEYAPHELFVNTESAPILTDDFAPVESLSEPLRQWALEQK